MRSFLILPLFSLVFFACASHRQVAVVQAVEQNMVSEPSIVGNQPAQAQTSLADTNPPLIPFSASEIAGGTPEKSIGQPTEALASNHSKTVASALKTSVALPKILIKAVQHKIKKIEKKRRPQGNGEILGLSPVLFFSLLAVLAGIILLFVTGKSQFFAILTLVLLIGGLLVAVAAFLEII